MGSRHVCLPWARNWGKTLSIGQDPLQNRRNSPNPEILHTISWERGIRAGFQQEFIKLGLDMELRLETFRERDLNGNEMRIDRGELKILILDGNLQEFCLGLGFLALKAWERWREGERKMERWGEGEKLKWGGNVVGEGWGYVYKL